MSSTFTDKIRAQTEFLIEYNALFVECITINREKNKLLFALGNIASRSPVYYEDGQYHCCFCYGESTDRHGWVEHEENCPWVAAKKLWEGA